VIKITNTRRKPSAAKELLSSAGTFRRFKYKQYEEGFWMIEIEQLVDVDLLRKLALEGTGRGVKVGILDTGVEADHPALEGAVKSFQKVVSKGNTLVCEPGGEDSVGHGTACAGIIHDLAPEAELHSLRVIGRDASGTVEQLLFGLKWAIDQKFDVINLSLGTVQKRMVSRMHALVDQAYFQGQILVAAANNFSQVSYPAHFASLIAVDNQSFENPLDFHYRLGQSIETLANGVYVRAPSPGGSFRLFTGTSFACPHITGLVTRLKSQIKGVTPLQIKSLLWHLRANRPGVEATA